jgi:nucleoid DNA-binding protein
VNRTEMVDIIARQREVSTGVVENVLSAFVDLVILNLAVGEPVTIRGFGRFDPKIRPSANLKHPRTGEAIATGERVTINFRPSRAAKRELNPLEPGTDPNRASDPAPCDATVASDGDVPPSAISTGISGGELMSIIG